MSPTRSTKALSDFAWFLWLSAGVLLGAWLATGAW